MTTWKSRGLRGSIFEELINSTNDYYREKGLALVQKIPTPIVPTQFNKETRKITEAYFEKDSTVDYIGAVQGIPICFDAKECHTDTFPLQNIHEHQYSFMKDFERQGGVAFLLIMFAHREDIYYMTFDELTHMVDRVKEGHSKNFKYNELRDEFFLKMKGAALVPYLEALNIDLNLREDENV